MKYGCSQRIYCLYSYKNNSMHALPLSVMHASFMLIFGLAALPISNRA